MAAPLVPSSFSSLSRGWTFRAIHSQNSELTLETCAPESISMITFCLLMIIGTSLDCPTRWATGSRSRKGMAGISSYLSLCQVAFIFNGHGLGLGWECEGLIVALGSCHWLGGELDFLSSPCIGLKQMLELPGHVAPPLAPVALERVGLCC